MSLSETLTAFFTEVGFEKTYWIAFSGGVDSHVLLSSCAALQKELPLTLRAIHIDHGLHPHSNAWASHCEDICRPLFIPIQSHVLKLRVPRGESLEEVARDARYAVFANEMGEGDVLITAHHEDDQAETFLLQLMRGAGLPGLASMPRLTVFAKGFHARPLLSIKREELLEIAEKNNLQWIEDEANANLKFTRNFIRHEVIPLLKTRFESASSVIARSGLHVAEGKQLLDEVAFSLLLSSNGLKNNTISIKKLSTLSSAKQKLLLRFWINQQGFLTPETRQLAEFLRQLLTAKIDRSPLFVGKDYRLQRYRDDLFLVKNQPALPPSNPQQWAIKGLYFIPTLGLLKSVPVIGQGLKASIEQVTVCWRQGGEAVKGSHHHHTLKNRLQEWGVPPWERSVMPLIYVGDELICVPDYFIHPAYAAAEGEAGYQVVLEKMERC